MKSKLKTKYVVLRKWHGGEKAMYSTYSYQEAQKYYHRHPKAFGIQKNRGGVTAGLIQPDMPNKMTIKGKTYKRPYVGPHTKREAHQLARNFRKSGTFKGVMVRKFKRGHQVYLRW